jgi:hypothetical protein
MTIYYIVYIILSYLCILAYKSPSKRSYYFKWGATIMFLLLGLRSAYVGPDTFNYTICYQHPKFYYCGNPTDTGFVFLLSCFRFFFPEKEFFLLMSSLVSLWGIYYLINHESKYKNVSLLLFGICGTGEIFYLTYFSMIRQACAMSFVFIGLTMYFSNHATDKKLNLLKGVLLLQKRQFYGLVLIIFATTIHASAAIIIPFLFIARYTSINKWIYTFIISITYIIGALNLFSFSELFTYISFQIKSSEHYNAYLEEMTFGEMASVGIINPLTLPFTIIALYILWFSKTNISKCWYLQFFLFGTILNNALTDNMMWTRLVLYFTIMAIIVIPNFLINSSLKIGKFFFLIIIAYYFYKTNNLLIYLNKINIDLNLIIPYKTWLFN